MPKQVDATRIFAPWFSGSSAATPSPSETNRRISTTDVAAGVGLGVGVASALAAWMRHSIAPSLQRCESDVREISRDMRTMEWPEPAVLPNYLEAFKAELDLFELRIKEVNANVQRCKKCNDNLANAAANLSVQFLNKTHEVVMRWAEESLESCVRTMQSILDAPTDPAEDYAGITHALTLCTADLAHADALRRHASWLPEPMHLELAESIMARQAKVQEIFIGTHERFRMPLREELWTAVKEVRANTSPEDIEFLEQAIANSEPLNPGDREILLHELSAHAERRQQ